MVIDWERVDELSEVRERIDPTRESVIDERMARDSSVWSNEHTRVFHQVCRIRERPTV